jgi:hypothetical protein
VSMGDATWALLSSAAAQVRAVPTLSLL